MASERLAASFENGSCPCTACWGGTGQPWSQADRLGGGGGGGGGGCAVTSPGCAVTSPGSSVTCACGPGWCYFPSPTGWGRRLKIND